MNANRKKGTVVVGMSGGVDSAVSAHLLKEQGFDVIGLFMKNWEEDDSDIYCAAAEDLDFATAVCNRLDIPLRTINFSHEYWERVFRIFLREYEAGRTPNPDVLCNREIKFNEFLSYAESLGAQSIATGHYAKCEVEGGNYLLKKGRDNGKDQSYFLYTLTQRELEKALFPLGAFEKTKVRRIARDLDLPNYDRKDSTGICFIGERKFKDFLARFLPSKPGDICTLDNEKVGRHDGLWFFTIGQRQGLDIGGPGEPWYVAEKNMKSNTLYVVQGHTHPRLMGNRIEATEASWVSGLPPRIPFRCEAKVRYRHEEQACTVSRLGQDRFRVDFDEPQWAITPGQSVVLYHRECVIGGGIIETSENISDS